MKKNFQLFENNLLLAMNAIAVHLFFSSFASSFLLRPMCFDLRILYLNFIKFLE